MSLLFVGILFFVARCPLCIDTGLEHNSNLISAFDYSSPQFYFQCACAFLSALCYVIIIFSVVFQIVTYWKTDFTFENQSKWANYDNEPRHVYQVQKKRTRSYIYHYLSCFIMISHGFQLNKPMCLLISSKQGDRLQHTWNVGSSCSSRYCRSTDEAISLAYNTSPVPVYSSLILSQTFIWHDPPEVLKWLHA